MVSSLTFSKSFMFRALVGETFSSDTFGSTIGRQNRQGKLLGYLGCLAFLLGLRAQKRKAGTSCLLAFTDLSPENTNGYIPNTGKLPTLIPM